MATTSPPTVSVIIPTYNRKDSLLRTLDSLSQQTYPVDRFEVIVVDDSTDEDTALALQDAQNDFTLRYVRGESSGAVGARNFGAARAEGEILLLLDDDILVEERYLEAMIGKLQADPASVVVASLELTSGTPDLVATPFLLASAATGPRHHAELLAGERSFTGVLAGAMAIRRDNYWAIGGMPGIGGDNRGAWTDVLFGYHAHQHGLKIQQCVEAIALHNDYASTALQVQCRVIAKAAQEAPLLFSRYPDLRQHLPMFRDKGPIQWRNDPPRLIARKLARQVASSRPVMWAMERSVPILERRAPQSRLLPLFYRWIVSGYIYHGYRDGLRLHQQRTQA